MGPQQTPPTRYTLQEAADQLGIGYSTLRKWIAGGRIGVERLSKSKQFVYRSEIEAFRKRHQQRFINPI